MILGELNLNIGPAVAGLGVVGIAVGFGTQSIVRDYFTGALILIENQFSKGDVVTIAGVSGTVEDFSLRRTTLRDLDGVVHTVPNGEIKVASNRTRVWARINLDVTIAYGTDIERATRVVDDVGKAMAADPEWRRRLMEAPHVERVEAHGRVRDHDQDPRASSAPPSSGRPAASCASACSRRSRPTASRSRGRSAWSSRATRTWTRSRPAARRSRARPRTTSRRERTDQSGTRTKRAWVTRCRPRRMAGPTCAAGGTRDRRPPGPGRA